MFQGVCFFMFDVVVLFDLVCRRFCEKLWLKDRIPTFESFPSVVRVSFSTFLKMWSLFLECLVGAYGSSGLGFNYSESGVFT